MQVRRLGLFVCAIALAAACQSPSPKAASVEEAPPHELTPLEHAAAIQRELGVVNAIEAASSAAIREVEKRGEQVSKDPPAALVRPDTKKLTIFFGANNQGERNDCGCHKNPLGGLGRRNTMLAALTNDDNAEIWGSTGKAIGPVFHVDAGDSVFANNTVDRGDAKAQKIAKYDAASVVSALALGAPDAVAVGENDLVFGADYLKSLTKDAGFPFISANVRLESGELAFPDHVVVERDGVKVAFVGLTRKHSRRENFFEDRKLEVDAPRVAAKRTIDALEPVDAIVLLSNLGLMDTEKLLGELRDDHVRVDLAIVSGTGRLTADPDFAGGVPVMEPLSRGKYVGRADLWLNGTETQFRNAATATPATLRDYRRAVRSYWTTRAQTLREQLKIAELEMSLETITTGQQPDTGAVVKELAKRRTNAIDLQKKRLETYQSRRVSTAAALLKAIENVRPLNEEPVGDDWVSGAVVPVKIEITPEPATRKLLDRREKKRPAGNPPHGMKLPH